MNALFLKDLAQKTRRGLEGRVRKGLSGGGNAYGYDVVREFGANGDPIRGKRRINENEAVVIRQIFRAYAAGKSARTIAADLNRLRTPGPQGKPWRDSTIHGNRRRGSGILNNELYIGRVVWNRQRYIKDPTTGRRLARLNPKEEWIIEEVSHLRIIGDDLWQAVKDRQSDLSFADDRNASGAGLNKRHRSQYLLSGQIRCGLCGGNFIIVAKDKYGCADHRTKGTCTDDVVLNRPALEAHILNGLKEKLARPELVDAFIAEFNAEVARCGADVRDQRRHREHRLRDIDRKLSAIVGAIEEGTVTETTRSRLLELESDKASIEKQLATPEPLPYPSLHPNLVNLYKRQLASLEVALNDPDIRLEASEVLRSLIDHIVVGPATNMIGDDGSGALETEVTRNLRSPCTITLHGELAAVFGLAEITGGIENNQCFSLGAGARSHLYRTRAAFSRPRERNAPWCY